MTRFFSSLLACAAFLVASPPCLKAGAIVEGETTDAMVTASDVNNGAYDTSVTLGVGQLYQGYQAAMVEPFALPYLAPGQTVSNASISFFLAYTQANSPLTCNVQLYGMKRVSTGTTTITPSDFYIGTNDSQNTLLDATFATPSTGTNQVVSYSGSNLTSFVQAQYANSAFSGKDLTQTRYVYFRLSADSGQVNFDNYQFSTSRNVARVQHPLLSLTIANGISNVNGRLQFSFTLPTNAVTSAGVYNPSTGALIRTLWGNQQFQAGTNYGAWDGNDDSGNPVASGSSYQIKMIYHNVQYVWDGTVGNSSATQSGPNVWRAYGGICDMAIAGGKAYCTFGYDELENPFRYFVIGQPQAPIEYSPGWTDPYSDYMVVASDGTKTYWGKATGGLSGQDTYIAATTNSNSQQYSFPKGVTPVGGAQKWTSCIDYDATAGQPNQPTGLAVQQSGNDLFVAHNNLNVVRVFDKVQGSSLGSFTVASPAKMAVTADGDVWVISNTATSPTVKRYTFSNGSATLKATISGVVLPMAVGVSADDSTVVVVDGGTAQQIKAYSNSSGAALWSYGVAGGMAANGPQVQNNAFAFTGNAFVAFQSDNTFWVEDWANHRTMHYSISNNTLNYIEQIHFEPATYQETVDLTDPTRTFNMFYEYDVNYSLPAGGTNGSWTYTKNWFYGLPTDTTHNYFGNLEGFLSVVTYPNGHTFGLVSNFATARYDLLELMPSGPARVTNYSFANQARLYPDGTLRYTVQNGSTGIAFYSQPLTGYDSAGTPLFGAPALLASTAIGSNDPQTWATYPLHTEVTASGMIVDYDGNQSHNGFHLGGITRGGSSYLWRSLPSTPTTYTGWFPQHGLFDCGNGVQYAGDVAMAMGRDVLCGYHGEFWKNTQASQFLDMYDNGLMVGRFGTYGSSNYSRVTTDGFAGNAFTPTLVRAANNNVYLYLNDESNHGGLCRWKITGWDGITEMKATATIGSTASLSGSASGPTVSITSPTPGAQYFNGTVVPVAAQVGAGGSPISSVQFYDGATSLGTVSALPFQANYTLAPGNHTLTAVATDQSGKTGTSASVTVTVGSDTTNTPPAAPVLSVGSVSSSSAALSWTQPGVGSTSTSIGQAISIQFDGASDGTKLTPGQTAGAPGYAFPNFNVFPQYPMAAGGTFMNLVNSNGQVIPNLLVNFQVWLSGCGGSLSTLTGTPYDIFHNQVNTTQGANVGVALSAIPYGHYDVVVYSLNLLSGTMKANLSLTDANHLTTVTQKFTKAPTTYVEGGVEPGTTTTLTDVNTVIFHDCTSSFFQLQGSNIAAVQVVERPFDQGAVASYSVQRAGGSAGSSFGTLASLSPSARSYTDSTVAASTTYQYRVQAVNSFGTATSNVASATTTTGSSGSGTTTPTTPTTPTGTTTPTAPAAPTGFAAWQAKYFTPSQQANSAISGASADPYGSGVPNLLAYALQLDPSTASPTDIPHATIVNGHLQLTYLAPASITDITFIVEVSTDLVTWHSGSGYTVTLANVSSSAGHTITMQEVLPSLATKKFMRLRVTQN
jgi:hypothetical protein